MANRMNDREDLELREKVFRRMSNGENSLSIGNHFINMIGIIPTMLPPIETSWEICAEYLVPFMRGKRMHYQIDSLCEQFDWCEELSIEVASQEIINDNIARAACEAFLGVEINGHE